MQPYVISKGIEREDKRPKPPFLRQKWPKKGHLRAFMRTSKFDNPLNFNNLAQKAAHTPPPSYVATPVEISKSAGLVVAIRQIFAPQPVTNSRLNPLTPLTPLTLLSFKIKPCLPESLSRPDRS